MKKFLPYFFSCICLAGHSQASQGFAWPIDSPRVITGNYGELRPNHFHAGIDFSTNGRVNLQVYAVQEGFVSRVRVNTAGYGKCVYITHPNGKVSVYAHLNSFSLKIANVVTQEQYALKSNEVEILPAPGAITVRKNEIIGLSGNTGGSTGPHLHFEIRDEKSETPLNVLRFYTNTDTTPPVITDLGFYSLADTSAPVFLRSFRVSSHPGDTLGAVRDSIVLDQSIVGLAFSGYDRFLPGGNQNTIHSARLYMDNRLIYSHRLDHIDFADNRYVNEFSEQVGRTKFQRCFLPSNYPRGMYGQSFNKGRVLLADSHYHFMRLVVADENGNECSARFYVKARRYNYYSQPSLKSDVFVNCGEDFYVKRNGLQLFIPAGTLYNSTPLVFENTVETTGKIIILPGAANLRAGAIIGFRAPEKALRYKDKLLLRHGSSVMTPAVKNDSVYYAIKTFGWFQVVADTLAPKITTRLSARKIKKTRHFNSFSFTITDNLSGILKYDLYVNEKWTLVEYDAKSDVLTYSFDEETPPGSLSFRLVAEDKVGNIATYRYSLKR